MVTRNISFAPGEHYHVYNRGNGKRTIFTSDSDYQRFLLLLYLSNTSQSFNVRDVLKSYDNPFEVKRTDTLVKIGAYCLMPNHFHLLISPLTEDGLSKFMLKLCTGYTMYFNTKYDRSGTLYESRFKAKYVDSDEYLKYLFSYIHLNPISKEDKMNTYHNIARSNESYQKVISYPYSSLREYISPRAALGLIDASVYGTYFEDKREIRKELFDWLEYGNETLDSALGLP